MLDSNFLGRLVYVPYGLISTSLLIGLVRFKVLDKIQRRVFLLVIFAGLTEWISRLLWNQEMNNFPVFHLYATIEFLIVISIYRHASQNTAVRRSLSYLAISFGLFSIANTAFLQTIYSPNTNVTTASSIILIALSLNYFYRVSTESHKINGNRKVLVYFNIAVLTYFSGAFVLFVFGGMLTELSLESTLPIWTVHIAFNAFYYLMLGVVLILK